MSHENKPLDENGMLGRLATAAGLGAAALLGKWMLGVLTGEDEWEPSRNEWEPPRQEPDSDLDPLWEEDGWF